MINPSRARVALCIAKNFSTSPRMCKTHYDVLELTPKATQGDIKSAYYKLSKIYHPDKSNNDEEYAKKFRAITEAYEVLGNITLKKMYDKGLLVGKENSTRMNQHPEQEPDLDPMLKFYRSRSHRHVVPNMTGNTRVYDFDTWSKNHYGNLFEKSQYDKEMLKKKRKKYEESMKSNNQEALIYLFFVLGGFAVVCVVHGTTDYDIDRTSTIKKNAKVQKQDPVNNTAE